MRGICRKCDFVIKFATSVGAKFVISFGILWICFVNLNDLDYFVQLWTILNIFLNLNIF